MTRWPRIGAWRMALAVPAALALLAAVVQAKSWKEWAPSPLGSDSTYAAFLARPSDSLTAAQLSWLAVQRDWRAERETEGQGRESSSRSITDTRHGRLHRERRMDERFAALASQSYEALPDTDRAWLVAENAAQRVARGSPDNSAIVGVAVAAAIAGALAAALLIAYAYSHSYYYPL